MGLQAPHCVLSLFLFSIVPNEEWASPAASSFVQPLRSASTWRSLTFQGGSGDVTIALPFLLALAIKLWKGSDIPPSNTKTKTDGKPQKASVDHRTYHSGGCQDSPKAPGCTAGAFLPEENTMWTRTLMQVRAGQHGLKWQYTPWEPRQLHLKVQPKIRKYLLCYSSI